MLPIIVLSAIVYLFYLLYDGLERLNREIKGERKSSKTRR